MSVYTNSGVVQSPTDLSKATFQALVPDGAGGYKTYLGAGKADGTFVISGLPPGPYLLQYKLESYSGLSHLWTTSSQVDLGYHSIGREGGTLAGVGTFLRMDVQGLEPVVGGDSVEWTIPSLGRAMGPFPLARDAVTCTVTRAWQGSPMLDASKGDQMIFTQLGDRTAPSGEIYTALKRGALVAAFTQVDGATQNFTAVLSPAPEASNPWHLTYPAAEYQGLWAAITPNASSTSLRATLSALPWGNPDPTSRFLGPTLAHINSSEANPDLRLAYGNPFPAAWTPVAQISANAVVNTPPITGSFSGITGLGVGATTYAPLDPTAPVKPLVGAPATPRINGGEFFTAHAGIGTTPTLSWSAPAVGSANFYTLQVVRYYLNNMSRSIEFVASFTTPNTQLQLPPGLLLPGESYFFYLGAVHAPGTDTAKAPFRRSMPYGNATCLSGMMQP